MSTTICAVVVTMLAATMAPVTAFAKEKTLMNVTNI
jgi:hypothetical protein